MDDFEIELKRTFVDEATLNLEEVEECFMALETSHDPKDLLDRIFRLAHNLKGGSRSVGFGDMAEFTHQLESLVLAIQKQKVALSTDVVSTLLCANDRLVEMITGLKSDMTARFDNGDMISVMAMLIETGGGGESIAGPGSAVADISGHFDSTASSAVAEYDDPNYGTQEQAPPAAAFDSIDAPASLTELVPAPASSTMPELVSAAPSERKGAQKSEKDGEVVRVNLQRVELLNDYVGELIVLQSVIQQQAASGQAARLQASLRQMAKLSKDVQRLSMGLRMLPVKPLIQKLQRVVRDTATALGKKVALELGGEQIDIDKSVLDQIADPLIHVLRNAVDHGIEEVAVRSASGKSEIGRIVLSFFNEGNHLVIEVSDDGKGIDAASVRKRALERNLVKAGDVLSEKQVFSMIFHPGFSTKEVTTEVSGRGVGMDVVKTNIEKMGGAIEIFSTTGKGSRFRLRIPLSLAVIEGLVTAAGKGRYVIPLSQVQETVNLASAAIHRGKPGIGDCMDLHGQVVPILRLSELMDPKAPDPGPPDTTALLFFIEDRPVAVSVQELMHSQQVVVKPLGNGLHGKPGWVGSCILGDGLPALIVNPVDLAAGKVAVISEERRKGAA